MIVKIEKINKENQLVTEKVDIYSKVLSLHKENDVAGSTFLYLEIEDSEDLTIVPIIEKGKNSEVQKADMIWLMTDEGKTIERLNI